jgi:hypothetical protein
VIHPYQLTVEASLRRFQSKIRLGTRRQCERTIEDIANWLKDNQIDVEKANALTNAVRVVLQSKKVSDEMKLKAVERDVIARLDEMEKLADRLEESDRANPEGSKQMQ